MNPYSWGPWFTNCPGRTRAIPNASLPDLPRVARSTGFLIFLCVRLRTVFGKIDLKYFLQCAAKARGEVFLQECALHSRSSGCSQTRGSRKCRQDRNRSVCNAFRSEVLNQHYAAPIRK